MNHAPIDHPSVSRAGRTDPSAGVAELEARVPASADRGSVEKPGRAPGSRPTLPTASTYTGVTKGAVRTRTVRSNTVRALLRLRQERGAATAEYLVATMAAVGFAGLLIVILRGDEVRGILTDLVRSALSVG